MYVLRWARLTPAHPRVSGENNGAWWLAGLAMGSSPRERGKLAIRQRIGPNRVAHPRVSGENTWGPGYP